MNAQISTEHEKKRLAALQRYDVLDTPPEEAFESIVQIATKICSTPIALITLIDDARQWFKARVGLELEQTSRDIAFCERAIAGKQLCTIPDALQDARLQSNPLVLQEPHIRFYAGVPLITQDGYALGTLCVIDRQPRPGLTPHERESLELLARETMLHLELRRALKELHDAKRTVELMNSEIEAFASAAAHDLRAPVRHIDGFVGLLAAECGDSPAAAQYVARIQSACHRMRSIIEALFRLSHAGHDDLHLEEVNLSALAQELAAELQSSDSQRQMEWKIEEGLVARVDASMLRILLSNLLSNAWKFSRQRSPARIEFGCKRDGGRIEYYVRDNGVGFDPAATSLLPAKPFKRHRKEEGVGLGLTLVERIVHRHGGELHADGAPDEGATFRFTLAAEKGG